MKGIEQVVKRYLKERNTDYAIMITGEWGCGKTYYVQHELKKLIEKETCFINSTEVNYKPFYISLNGISDVSDIYIKILENVFPIFKNKLALIVRRGFGAILSLKGLDSKAQKEFSSFTEIKKNTVLVFDDLERIINDKIEIKEVLGVINQFVEHDNLKVIVICNDEKVKESFSDFKEKTIRYSLKFQRPFSESFDAILSEKENTDYLAFLKDQKELVLQIFQLGRCNNLRTLKFVIETFNEVYDKVKGEKHKTEILKDLLVSMAIYSIEYKNGVKDYDLTRLSELNSYFINHLGKEKGNRNKDYSDELWEKYGEIEHAYHYFPIINNYVTNGYLDSNQFNSFIFSLNEKYRRLEDTLEGLLLKKLSDWRLIKDEEFHGVITNAIKAVGDNKYTIADILSIYSFLLAFEELGVEDFIVTEETTHVFEKAIKTALDQDEYDNYILESLGVLKELQSTECTIKRRKLIEYMKEENDKKRLCMEQEEVDGFLKKLQNGDSDAFYQDMKRDIHHLLFTKLNAVKVAETLTNSPLEVLEVFRAGLYSMYPDHNSFELQEKERDFLIQLKNRIDSFIKAQKQKKLSLVWYQLMLNKLNSILENDTARN